MKLYRFSPVRTEEELREALMHVHYECFKLCKQSLGKYLPVAGNIAHFCHYDDEYETLTELRKKLTEPTNEPNQKYFRLYEPLVMPARDDIPETVYTHLYIRQPDIYRAQVGDVDFIVEPEEYDALKSRLASGEKIAGARIFPRADLDMIELYNPDIDALGYISIMAMAEKVHIKTNFT